MSERLNHNPDVLSCLANLSNDEVLTPPEVANAMLDMLPQELFRDPNARFLDPACKSGIFLREIAKRLLDGLKESIPDRQERIDHIFHKQLYGIAITELTSLLARRSLYCSKHASSIYSVTAFDDIKGNIRFKRIEHTWDSNGKCQYCGASKEQFDRGVELETHAYEFIHIKSVKELHKMKFDLIISNPPYQLDDGGNKASAKPIYHLFVDQAKKLKPRYLSMIIPSRWFAGGKGLDDFRDGILRDPHLRKIVDFFDAQECFPGVDISGGVCYFLWNRDFTGDCEVVSHLNGKTSKMIRPLLEESNDSFVRFNQAIPILRKVKSFKEQSFSDIVSSRKPFGIDTKITMSTKPLSSLVKIYAYPEDGYIEKSKILRNKSYVDKYKVFISYAYGERGSFPYLVIGKPFIGEPGSCCTETYLLIGTYENVMQAENVISYMRTRFFRFLVLLKKNTQHATKNVYQFVPLQDFSRRWSDQELFEKYGFSDDEISFIESMIRSMDAGGSDA